LNPILSVEGREFWLATHELFAVDRRILRQKIATVADRRDVIIAALDFVFTGF
jgi:toxin CcdB